MCTGLEIRQFVIGVVRGQFKIVIADIMKSMPGLDHIAENGILHILYFVSYQEMKMQDIVLVLCGSLIIALYTWLEMKPFVERAARGPFNIVIVGIMKNLT